MAGSNAVDTKPGRAPRHVLRGLSVLICLGSAGVLAAPGASAQVPAMPSVPAPVSDAIGQAQDVVVPVLVDGAIQAQPAANALGFIVRPACSGAGTAVVLVAIGGGSLPASPLFVITPLLLFCAGAYAPGPADPVFKQVDGVVGPELENAVAPVLAQAHDALTPARPNLSEACSALALMGSTPSQLPPPLHRLNLVKVVC
jgi:hypothetical protein